ncbi:hypothetical protein MD535_06660 [Vibrio sp. ZSDZ65]|uniref:Uncharacterized protein n=1 Tax=Vibrio qingdaonensis TaxID=2829491 RepID=A0A9X3CNN3_9VIBR|nr:hypothetical protein [Vibrio qingdaonensis]MCW8345690.1 hypothetical protein [Vibrio qingdaonensis]
MDRTCPMCSTPMITRDAEAICPRHQIGDCSYAPNLHDFESEAEVETDKDSPY